MSTVSRLIMLTFALFAWGGHAFGQVEVNLVDLSWTHVHPPGQPFSVEVSVTAVPDGARVFASWVGPQETPLADPIELTPDVMTSLTSPVDSVGYCGLVFYSDDPTVSFPPQEAGWPSSAYGFAILPETSVSAPDPRIPYGTIHTNVFDDPYMRGGSKSLSWHTTGAEYWFGRIQETIDGGFVELPLVFKDKWDSDDTVPITEDQLLILEQEFRDYLGADARVRDWELGLGENAGSRYNDFPYYFDNLLAKVSRVRQVANEINPDVRFVYNFRGYNSTKLRQLLTSEAIEVFDILSMHWYRWPDFPSAETWLPDTVQWVRDQVELHGAGHLELWITEFGIPVRGNRDPNGFYGYPDTGVEIPGSTPHYAASYLVKAHPVAVAAGIDHLFMYNYQNRGNDIYYAEDHFGLRAYTGNKWTPGHPLPAYVAYANLMLKTAHREMIRSRVIPGDVHLFDYTPMPQDLGCIMAWAPSRTLVALDQLRPGLAADGVLAVTNLYGERSPMVGDFVVLDEDPVYVELQLPERTGRNQGAPPRADFSGSPLSGSGPLSVQFQDDSTGRVQWRQWSFGDGQVSTDRNPSHTYQDPGTYTVILSVANAAGSATETRVDYVTVEDDGS